MALLFLLVGLSLTKDRWLFCWLFLFLLVVFFAVFGLVFQVIFLNDFLFVALAKDLFRIRIFLIWVLLIQILVKDGSSEMAFGIMLSYDDGSQ